MKQATLVQAAVLSQAHLSMCGVTRDPTEKEMPLALVPVDPLS